MHQSDRARSLGNQRNARPRGVSRGVATARLMLLVPPSLSCAAAFDASDASDIGHQPRIVSQSGQQASPASDESTNCIFLPRLAAASLAPRGSVFQIAIDGPILTTPLHSCLVEPGLQDRRTPSLVSSLSVGRTTRQWQRRTRRIAGARKSRVRSWQPFINRAMHSLGVHGARNANPQPLKCPQCAVAWHGTNDGRRTTAGRKLP